MGPYERKALGTSISLHGGSFGQLEVGSSTRDFERRLTGALEVKRLSLKKLRGRASRGSSSLGTLEDMLSKAPDTEISLHSDLFTNEGNLESGEGLIYRGL
jgi:hypothetical protein